MDDIKNLIDRFRNTGFLFLIGLLLIIYIALGFLYVQQAAEQKEFEGQITKLSLVIARPLPSDEELKDKHEKVNLALVPMTDQEAIYVLVSIAEESGINIDPDAGKLRVPPASFSQTQVGGGKYKLLSFRSIYVQGDHDNVMAFISDLDSGRTLKTMVLRRVATGQKEVMFTGEEGERRAEFRSVVSAVLDMMDDNGLSSIPNPMSYNDGVAANLTGDDPDTAEVVEGFPDITTTAAEKGYSGNATARDGYVLYRHDVISTDNTSEFETVNYINMLATKYYYTCEADGTVWQFDGADVATATGYVSGEASKIETVATVDVDIYIKAAEK